MKIACLHTAQSNVDVFEHAAREVGIPAGTLSHQVMPHLLAQAEAVGGMTPEIEKETIAALAELRTDADVVLLTCSTLGSAANYLAQDPGIVRVDLALAQEAAAARAGGPVVVLCAAPTTIKPTAALFRAVAPNAPLAVELIPGAWDAFKAGQLEAYFAMIAERAQQALDEGAGCVALAQASMAGAKSRITHPKVLTSPHSALHREWTRLQSIFGAQA
ncbi:glutamate racemase [Franconibacter helveticus]|uniref:glutamate racemase n=1 Tax=Franconibacter helveticus TaxID=357240 RepID=UPI002909C5E0|nr:glutamate racemase [Franconibacter helveticus]MDU6924467.1 glutamate racemase [Franconibacter helveticus]